MYIITIKTNEEQTRMKVAFKEKITKTEVIKLTSKLKGKEVWICDDLTMHRSRFVYLARQAKKNKKIKAYWVHDSKVFIIKLGEEKLCTIISPPRHPIVKAATIQTHQTYNSSGHYLINIIVIDKVTIFPCIQKNALL